MEGYKVSDFLKNLSYMQGNGSPGGASGFDVDDFLQPDMDRSFALRRGAGNQGRIEEISRRLDEIAKEKKAIDTEKAMAEYKYLYDADPGAYMNLMHNRKTAEQTEQIRKGSEEATRQSNLQSAYKANNDGLLAARYSLADAENAYRQAVASGNPEAAEAAKVKLDRERAMYSKYAKENEVLRNKVMQAFGIAQEAPAVAQEGASGAENASGEDIAHQEAMKGLNAFQDALGAIRVLSGRIKVDNMPKDKNLKAKQVKEWGDEIARLQQVVNGAKVGTQQKSDAIAALDQLSEQVRSFSKPASKGGQAVKATKEDYQKKIDGLNFLQLRKLGYNFLMAAQKAGATHPRLADAIQREAGGK